MELDQVMDELDQTYEKYLQELYKCNEHKEDKWIILQSQYNHLCSTFSEAYLSGSEWYNYINQFKSLKEAYFNAKFKEKREETRRVDGDHDVVSKIKLFIIMCFLAQIV